MDEKECRICGSRDVRPERFLCDVCLGFVAKTEEAQLGRPKKQKLQEVEVQTVEQEAPEQKAAYVISQSVCALAEIEAMKALNAFREMRGETIAYDEDAFLSVINKYGISHNHVISLFR